MRRCSLAVTLAVALTLVAGCFKGDKKECEAAARNYAKLVFWKSAEVKLAALPEAERALAREKMTSEYETVVEREIEGITAMCVSANNDEMVACMKAAKTSDAALKCAEPLPPNGE